MTKPHRPDLTWREYVRLVIGDDRQIDVAARTGIDQATVSRWLRDDNGDTRPPQMSPRNVRAFARGYGQSVLEAFVVAGYLSEAEAGVTAPRLPDWRSVSDAELLAELRRRLRGRH